MPKTISLRNWLISILETILINSWALLRTIISKKSWKSPKILTLKMLYRNFHPNLSFQELAAPLGLKDLDPAVTTARASTNTSPPSKISTKNVAWLASSTRTWTFACNLQSVNKLRRNPKCENKNKAKLINSASHSSKVSCTNKINHRFSIIKIKTLLAPKVIWQVQKLLIWTILWAIPGEKLMTIKQLRAI